MPGNTPEFGRPPRIKYESEEEKAILEAENGFNLFDRVGELIDEWDGKFQLTPEIVREFHQLSVSGIYGCAGEYRELYVGIVGSSHVPPKWREIPGLVDEMCRHANENFAPEYQSLYTASYLLWRLVWIHPFMGANGRIARALAYLAICVGYNQRLPGKNPIPLLIDNHKEEYLDCLEHADEAWKREIIDLDRVESFLSHMLVLQLED